ncbi:glycosyltransferase family 22 protein, partial [Acidomyces richmondensis BFW]
VFVGLFVFRLVNALSIRTFFQPDEYFQALEPAWEIAFGPNSGAWITWEWRERLRSSLHPLLFASAYRSANLLAQLLDMGEESRAELLIAAPKAIQALIAALGDFFTWKFAGEVYGNRSKVTNFALALTVVNPWQWYCSVRTFSNSLETTFTIAAFYFWPWRRFLNPGRPPNRQKASIDETHPTSSTIRLQFALIAAAFACILRPTNIIIWVSITAILVMRFSSTQEIVSLMVNAIEVGFGVLTVSIALDYSFYHDWVFPPLRFLYFNILQSLAVFYGKNRANYYFTEGLPLLLTTSLPFAVIGLGNALRSQSPSSSMQKLRIILGIVTVLMVLAMTLISHKEVRFIYPLLPILNVLAAQPAAASLHLVPLSNNKLRLGLMILMLTFNICFAGYVSLVHQRGVIDVMNYLRQEREASSVIETSYNLTIGFLMPCHSTPWRSHLIHVDIDAWALTCEPPLHIPLAERQGYMDEADIFYTNPQYWLENNMQDLRNNKPASVGHNVSKINGGIRRPWPEYLVFFQQLEPVIEKMLANTRYGECWRGFNTHWHDDWRRKGDVVVWC